MGCKGWACGHGAASSSCGGIHPKHQKGSRIKAFQALPGLTVLLKPPHTVHSREQSCVPRRGTAPGMDNP